MKRCPASVVRKARAMYRPGKFGFAKIAKALGVKKSTVRGWLTGTMRAAE